jgi:hypothetical protein
MESVHRETGLLTTERTLAGDPQNCKGKIKKFATSFQICDG